ncbi:MAG: TIGR02266 family protein [Deltaproteobacteria bacterium]|jgi:uncharacterized protein (TIGR02266 family)|nr:TIGR02266 family protein [Deltaproteobacteria bacterium]
MSKTERRAGVRVPTRFKVDYSHEGNYLISYSKNISAEGMFICTDEPVPVGTNLKLVFSIEDLHEVVVTARVAWVNLQGGKGDTGLGLEFIDPPALLKKAILQLVNRIAVVEPQNQ